MNLFNAPTTNGDKAVLYFKRFDLLNYLDLLTIRQLPQYEVKGRVATFPARYLDTSLDYAHLPLEPTPWLFDYQAMLVKVCWLKRRYALFLDPGLGKTYIMAELARQLHTVSSKKILFCTELNPLYQLREMCHEIPDFPASIMLYGQKQSLKEWLHYGDERIGFINHDYFIRFDENISHLCDAFFLDESSILKHSTGRIGKNLIAVTKGIDVKIASSGTPSPNDHKEYARHSLFLEYVTSENEFLQQFFVKKDGKWTLKRHAGESFFKELGTWGFFMRSPKDYGFNDNLADLPDIREERVHVPMTDEQIEIIHNKFKGRAGLLPGLATRPETMRQRTKFSQVSKGFYYDEQ